MMVILIIEELFSVLIIDIIVTYTSIYIYGWIILINYLLNLLNDLSLHDYVES